MTKRTTGVGLLFAVLAGFLLLGALPNQVGGIRVAGLSLLWWYGGVVGPLVGALAAVLCLSSPPGEHRDRAE